MDTSEIFSYNIWTNSRDNISTHNKWNEISKIRSQRIYQQIPSKATFLKYRALQLEIESKCQRCWHPSFILALEKARLWVYEFESRQGYMVRPFLCLSSCHHYKNQQQQQKTDIKKTIPLKVVTHTYSYKKTKRTLKSELKILKLDIEW